MGLAGGLGGLDLWILPHPSVSDTHVEVRVHRQPVSGTVVMASDGATGVQAIAYVAVLADEEGIFADAWSSVQVANPYPWAAQWLGRYLGVWVLCGLKLPSIFKVYAAADGAHTTTEGKDVVQPR